MFLLIYWHFIYTHIWECVFEAENGCLVWFRSGSKMFADMWDKGYVKMGYGWAWVKKSTQMSSYI